MGTGYTRNDTANNIADGNVINASDLDGEFDAIQSAFNATTGHSHDGTTGEGPQIATGGLADDAVTGAKIDSTTTITAAGFTGPLTGNVTGNVTGDLTGGVTLDQALDAAGNNLTEVEDIGLRDRIFHDDDTDTYLQFSATDTFRVVTGNVERMFLNNTGTVFNETGADVDFRVEGDTATHMLFVDAGNDRVGIANSSPATALDVTGTVTATGLDVNGAGDVSGNLTVGGNLNLGDNDKAQFGASQDFQVYFDGTATRMYTPSANTIIRTAKLDVQNGDGSELMAVFNDDSAVSLYYDNAKKFETKSDGVDITGELQADSLDIDGAADISGNLTLGGNLDISDNDQMLLGTGDDLKIFHDGSNSYIQDVGTGDLRISAATNLQLNSANGETLAQGTQDGKFKLYHNNSLKLATESYGVDITGELQADSLDIDGAAVFNESGANVDFRVESDGEPHMLFVDASTNRVGVGTSSPARRLTVETTDFVPIRVRHTDGSGGYIGFMDTNTTDDTEVLVGAVGNDLAIHTGDVETFRIKSDGKVGIGDSSPSYKLDVDGDINFTGTLRENGVAFSGGGGLFKGENGEVGSSAGDIFRVHEQTLNTNVTIDSDENGLCAGPLTIASGVTLTVNGNLSIV